MAACPKISREGVFSKIFRPGGYTKNSPYPLFPLPAHVWCSLKQVSALRRTSTSNASQLVVGRSHSFTWTSQVALTLYCRWYSLPTTSTTGRPYSATSQSSVWALSPSATTYSSSCKSTSFTDRPIGRAFAANRLLITSNKCLRNENQVILWFQWKAEKR